MKTKPTIPFKTTLKIGVGVLVVQAIAFFAASAILVGILYYIGSKA